MSADRPRTRALPEHPSLEHLKNEAKERLAQLRADAPEMQLSEAQFQIARDYGYSSWRALKTAVESKTGEFDIEPNIPLEACAGIYAFKPGMVDNFFIAVAVAGDKLSIEPIVGAHLLASRGEDGWFHSKGMSVARGFGDVEDGRAQTMHIEQDGRQRSLHRITDAQALAMKKAQARALADQDRPRSFVSVADDILARYTGHYVLHDGNFIEISVRDHQLFVQIAGAPKLGAFPESETTFFTSPLSAQFTFEMRGQEVIALIMRLNGIAQIYRPATAQAAKELDIARQKRLAEQLRPRQPVAIDPSILPRYAGVYRIGPKRNMTVTVEGAHIFAEITDQLRYEIYPESENKFFWTAVGAQVAFESDETGRITHAVLHQVGREVPMTRIKDDEKAA